ncbi:MAG: hypothetical protein IPH35_04000 [Rhodoferax sp.]|nr:hypothetical protein [Rhodoferax sp.]
MIQITNEWLQEKMQRKYSVAEYLQKSWNLCALVRSTPFGEEQFLKRIGLAKELCDEMVPIGYFCELFLKLEAPQAKVSLKLGNQTYDATVEHEHDSGSKINFIEVTSLEDQTEHKTRTELHRNGVVTAIKRDSEWVAERGRILARVLAKKLGKEYPKGTALIIYCKDESHPTEWDSCIKLVGTTMCTALDQFELVCILDREHIWQLSSRQNL